MIAAVSCLTRWARNTPCESGRRVDIDLARQVFEGALVLVLVDGAHDTGVVDEDVELGKIVTVVKRDSMSATLATSLLMVCSFGTSFFALSSFAWSRPVMITVLPRFSSAVASEACRWHRR